MSERKVTSDVVERVVGELQGIDVMDDGTDPEGVARDKAMIIVAAATLYDLDVNALKHAVALHLGEIEKRNMRVKKLARLISELEAALPSHPELEDAVEELKDVLFDAENEPEILEGGESAVDEAEALLESIKG